MSTGRKRHREKADDTTTSEPYKRRKTDISEMLTGKDEKDDEFEESESQLSQEEEYDEYQVENENGIFILCCLVFNLYHKATPDVNRFSIL